MWNEERPGFMTYIEEKRQGTQKQTEKSPRQRARPPCELMQTEQRRFARDAQQTGRSAASHPNRPACHRSLGGQWRQEGDPRPALWTRKRRSRKPCPACATPRSGEWKRLGLHRFNRNRLESGQPSVRLRASTRIPNFSNLIHPEAEPVWNGGRPDACGRREPEPLPVLEIHVAVR